MSIHIPTEVVFFLNALGIPYPDVDVDQVREMGRHVRDFATDVRGTYDEATGTLEAMGSSMSGNSYQTILVVWSAKSDLMAELDTAFELVAKALEIAADVIEAIQIAVLIELAALAASFVANMFTPAAPATGPLLALAARRIMKEMAEFVMWYLIGEVLMNAVEPLLDKFDQFIRDTLLPPGSLPTSDSSGNVYVDPDEVDRYVKLLEQQADDMASHGDKFNEKIADLDFTTPGLDVPPGEWPSPSAPPPPNSTLPNSLPNVLPGGTLDIPHPTAQASSPESSDNKSTPVVDQRAGGGSTPPGTASPGIDPGTSVAPSEAPAAAAPGSAGSSVDAPSNAPSTSAGVPSAGIDPGGQGESAVERAPIASGDTGYNADRTESEAAQHRAGETSGMIAPGAVQSGPSTQAQSNPSAQAQSNQSVPAQSQTSSASNSQRPGEAAANKAQGSTGRAAADGGKDGQQTPARKTSQTPWSRGGGKAARVAPATKRPAERVPAVSAGEADNRDEAARPASDSARSAPPQVFAPETVAPPVELPSAKPSEAEAEADRERAVPAEPSATQPDPSVAAGRPQG